MRRLLIAATLLLTGQAQAVDYVQCQAMQRTIWQLEEDHRRAKVAASSDSKRRLMVRDCGVMPKAVYREQSYSQTTESEQARKEYLACADKSEVTNRTVIKLSASIDPDVIIIGNRLQRVKKDFSRSCY